MSAETSTEMNEPTDSVWHHTRVCVYLKIKLVQVDCSRAHYDVKLKALVFIRMHSIASWKFPCRDRLCDTLTYSGETQSSIHSYTRSITCTFIHIYYLMQMTLLLCALYILVTIINRTNLS